MPPFHRFTLVAVAVLAFLLAAASAHARGLNDNFVIGLEQPVSNGVPGPGAGNLESPGATDTYTLTITAPTSIYAEEIGGSCSINWIMRSPSNAIVFNDAVICGGDPGVKVLTEIGDYTITVAGQPTTTGTYSFTIWELNAPQLFSIGLEQLVSNGSPAAGAGNLEEPGAKDIYSIPLVAGQSIFAQEVGGSCSMGWTAVAPSGAVLFSDAVLCGGHPGVLTPAETGVYSITVDSSTGITGTYSFKIWQLNPPEQFPIALKQTISNGVPAAGAGNLEEPGAVDVYKLSISTPVTAFLEFINGNCQHLGTLTAPSGATLVSNAILCGNDPGAVVLSEVGDYEFRVVGNNATIGTYSFRFWELNEPQTFSIAIGDVVSNGSPGVGAGNLEEPGAKDVYLVNITSPTTIFADAISGSCSMQWTLARPDGSFVFSNGILCGDPGQFTLDTVGLYTVTVSSTLGVVGGYSFTLTNVNPPQQFVLAPEEIISNGVPARGAGNIEENGSVDVYAISLTAGQEIVQHPLGGSCNIHWTLTAPSGAVLFSEVLLCAAPSKHLITESGVHSLTVHGVGDTVGTYSGVIHLLDVPQEFVIAIGDTVSPGFPGRGAGTIEEPFSIDRYSFSAVEGDLVCFNPHNGPCNTLWSATTPSGAVLFADELICGVPPGRFALPETGTYVISVGNVFIANNYSFTLEEGAAADIAPPEGDCRVNASDLAVLLGAWGPCRGCEADLNGDGQVNASDLAILLGAWD
ncbi:MAG: hypothetical protein JNL80_02250 [Phycisphaerae bacterium]|jgi:hypothetical protein|nr:hypothetical protein [Phycisphaerae bacterium]